MDIKYSYKKFMHAHKGNLLGTSIVSRSRRSCLVTSWTIIGISSRVQIAAPVWVRSLAMVCPLPSVFINSVLVETSTVTLHQVPTPRELLSLLSEWVSELVYTSVVTSVLVDASTETSVDIPWLLILAAGFICFLLAGMSSNFTFPCFPTLLEHQFLCTHSSTLFVHLFLYACAL